MAPPVALAHTMQWLRVQQQGQAVARAQPAAARRPTSSWRRGAGRPQRGARATVAVRAAAAAGIEPIGNVRPEIDAAVQRALDRCLTETDLGMGKKYRVRSCRGGAPRPQQPQPRVQLMCRLRCHTQRARACLLRVPPPLLACPTPR